MPQIVLRLQLVAVLILLDVWIGASLGADATPPLHRQIDELIAARAGGPLALQSSDEEYLRRVYLDLAGRIPALSESQAFFEDCSSDKRAALIDRLLASDDHVRRMTQVFHVMLMERMGDHPEWQKFLQESFRSNRPWDEMVRHILSPQVHNEASRGSALWYTKRLEKYGENPVDIPGLVRDVGRHFLGIDVQCAQCHDHLFVDDYKQEFYHGLFAFVGNTQIRTDLAFPAVMIKPLEKKVEFISVFVQQQQTVGPKLPGKAEIEIPTFAKGEEFLQPPDKKTKFPGVPKFNSLEILAEQLPRAEYEHFTRNIANRLYWLMLGRGLVEPLDMHHTGNPPSHPELLDTLADELAEHKFDMRWLLREIALTETYQRSSVAASDDAAAPPQSYCVALEKPLSSEQMLVSLRQSLGNGKSFVVSQGDQSWTKWQTLFDKALANPAREPEVGHNPTVKAALFLMHDTTVLQWIKPADGNLTARLIQQEDATALASELYLAVLSRAPTEDEQAAVNDYLASRAGEREAAVMNLVWSLVASNEFCTNH